MRAAFKEDGNQLPCRQQRPALMPVGRRKENRYASQEKRQQKYRRKWTTSTRGCARSSLLLLQVFGQFVKLLGQRFRPQQILKTQFSIGRHILDFLSIAYNADDCVALEGKMPAKRLYPRLWTCSLANLPCAAFPRSNSESGVNIAFAWCFASSRPVRPEHHVETCLTSDQCMVRIMPRRCRKR